MAHVYLALFAGPADFNKLLVLKVMRDGVLGDTEGSVQMFLNEARLAARLVHPNIIHTYEVGESSGRYFLAMEYLEGQTYRSLTRKAGPFGVGLFEHLRILTELSRGLHYLHEQTNFDGRPLGAVHRDVSPQNVLLGYDGQVKLLDFGIAKTAEAAHWTQVDTIKGKIDYIAPEQLMREDVDRRADVFALGVLLYEAISGQRFAGGSSVADFQKVEQRLKGTEPKLPTIAPAAPKALIAIAERALAVDPAERYPTAAAFADALDGYASSTPRPSAAKLGARLAQLFAQDRDALRKLVEREIEKSREGRYVELGGEATGPLPRFEKRETATRTSATWPQIDPPRHAVAARQASVDEAELARASLAGDSGQSPVPRRRSLAALGRPRSWSLVLAIVAGAAALAWLTTPARDDRSTLVPAVATTDDSAELGPAASAAQASEVRAPQTTAPPRRQDTILVKLSVVPSHARVQLDGVTITAPFTGELPRDDKLHMVRASARGYRSTRQLVGFDRDREILLELRAHQPSLRARGSEATPTE